MFSISSMLFEDIDVTIIKSKECYVLSMETTMNHSTCNRFSDNHQ